MKQLKFTFRYVENLDQEWYGWFMSGYAAEDGIITAELEELPEQKQFALTSAQTAEQGAIFIKNGWEKRVVDAPDGSVQSIYYTKESEL